MALTRRARLVAWVGTRKGIAVLIADRTRQYHGTWVKPPSVDGYVAVPSYPGRFRSFNHLGGYASDSGQLLTTSPSIGFAMIWLSGGRTLPSDSTHSASC